MRYYIFTENPHNDKEIKIVHKVCFPDRGGPKSYITITSLNSFFQGNRKGKKDKSNYKNGCNYSPKSYFCEMRFEIWERRFDDDYYKKYPTLDERNWPMFEHASLWDFYKFIGFDHKKREYAQTV